MQTPCYHVAINSADMYMYAHNLVNIWEKQKINQQIQFSLVSVEPTCLLLPGGNPVSWLPIILFPNSFVKAKNVESAFVSLSLSLSLSYGDSNLCIRLQYSQVFLNIYSFSIQKLCLGRKRRFRTVLQNFQLSDSLTGIVTSSMADRCPAVIVSPIAHLQITSMLNARRGWCFQEAWELMCVNCRADYHLCRMSDVQECFGFTMHSQTNYSTLQSKSNDFKSLWFGSHVLSRTRTSIFVWEIPMKKIASVDVCGDIRSTQ